MVFAVDGNDVVLTIDQLALMTTPENDLYLFSTYRIEGQFASSITFSANISWTSAPASSVLSPAETSLNPSRVNASNITPAQAPISNLTPSINDTDNVPIGPSQKTTPWSNYNLP